VPRRPTPLDPADGAGARFALELRVLRDRLGADAPDVEKVARTVGVSRATVYAVLNGRIPSRATLQAIVTAWGGDVQEWLAKRRVAEAEVERERLRRVTSRVTPARDASHVSRRRRTVPPESARANPAVQEFAAALRYLRAEKGDPSLYELREGSEAPGGWGRRRRAAGHPPVGASGVPHATMSYLFRGQRFPQWGKVRGLVESLGGDVDEWRRRWVAMAQATELDQREIEWVENLVL
jgi:transcriptional regulator with XRE-family HTH domain